MRDDCNEIHGMNNAKRLGGMGYHDAQDITICADGTWVQLAMSTSNYPAGMTPDQARYLARKLYRVARLVEQRKTAP